MELAERLNRLGTETAFAVSAAAAAHAAEGNKVYPFHLGDMNLPTPASIVEEMNRAVSEGFTGYCPGSGIPELRAALAADIGAKRGMSYTPDEVSIQPGGKPVIGKFLRAVMNAGDEVLYPNPGYPIYESQIEFQGGVAVPYGFVADGEGGLSLDMEALKSSITPKTKVLIYNNYHNPTGAVSSESEMAAVAELALQNDLWVLADEAYYEVLFDEKATSIAAIPGMRERTVILYTFSKRFAMTGWRLGAAIGPKPVIDVINKLNTNAESCTTHFIQRALVKPILEEKLETAAIMRTLRERRDVAVAGLQGIEGVKITAPESTFYLFPDVSEVMARKGYEDVNRLMDEALADYDVSFCTRKHFGRPLPGETHQFIRLAYSGIDVPDIQAAIARLKEYFEK